MRARRDEMSTGNQTEIVSSEIIFYIVLAIQAFNNTKHRLQK